MKRRQLFVGIALGIFLLGACVTLVVLAGIRQLKERDCDSHLRYVCFSLALYCGAQRGHLPPAYLLDQEGRPIHSWRTLLLPYLTYDYVYKHYKFAEPWDSLDNRAFAEKYSWNFACPSHSILPANTNYVAVTGEETLWPAPKTSVTFEYRRAGEHETPWPDVASPAKLPESGEEKLLIVELVNSDIPWTAPRDMPLEDLVELVEADATGKRLKEFVRKVATIDAAQKIHLLDPINDFERIKKVVASAKTR